LTENIQYVKTENFPAFAVRMIDDKSKRSGQQQEFFLES